MENLNFSMSVIKEDEDILVSLNCNLKSFIDFTIVDEVGVLLVTNSRVLFCKYVGSNLSVIHNFGYKLITSFNIKEDDDKNKYIIFKYNGDRVKITNIKSGDILEVAEIITKKQRVL
ncbi:PH domain-containing protein [Intestinibacter sp.]